MGVDGTANPLAPELARGEPHPVINGDDGERKSPNAWSTVPGLWGVCLLNDEDVVAMVVARANVAWALPFPFAALTAVLPFANSSCRRASSSAVSCMYEAGGRGSSGGGVSGPVSVCGVKIIPGDEGEWGFCCGGGGEGCTEAFSAAYFALSIAFSSAALRTRCEAGIPGLEGGRGCERERRCGGNPDGVAGGEGCHGGGCPPSGSRSEPLECGRVPVTV